MTSQEMSFRTETKYQFNYTQTYEAQDIGSSEEIKFYFYQLKFYWQSDCKVNSQKASSLPVYPNPPPSGLYGKAERDTVAKNNYFKVKDSSKP